MLGLGAARLDWTDGAAVALGEAAGVAAPLAGLGLVGGLRPGWRRS